MTTIIAVSVIASFIIAAAIGPALIRYLHNMNFGQKILSYVPEHAGKQNTPTMGGFMFIISITLVTILSNVIPCAFDFDSVIYRTAAVAVLRTHRLY